MKTPIMAIVPKSSGNNNLAKINDTMNCTICALNRCAYCQNIPEITFDLIEFISSSSGV